MIKQGIMKVLNNESIDLSNNINMRNKKLEQMKLLSNGNIDLRFNKNMIEKHVSMKKKTIDKRDRERTKNGTHEHLFIQFKYI